MKKLSVLVAKQVVPVEGRVANDGVEPRILVEEDRAGDTAIVIGPTEAAGAVEVESSRDCEEPSEENAELEGTTVDTGAIEEASEVDPDRMRRNASREMKPSDPFEPAPCESGRAAFLS